MQLRVDIHNRTYDSWDFTQDDVKVDIPNLIPSKHKLFHNDVFLINNYENPVVIIAESVIRDSFIAGVLILNKTYGRSGKRLLYKCIPDNKLLPVFLVPYDIRISFTKVVKNKYIVFRFTEWETDHPHGEIKETLGDVDCSKAFNEYQLYKRGLHISLSTFANVTRSLIKRTGNEEATYIQTILNVSKYGIEDYRSIDDVFTIDPAGCTDFDDAFSVSIENDECTVNVYIANVYVWLETYGLWEHMTNRVSTIYLPDKKHPMLPPILSDDLCSLKQGSERFAFMMSLKYDMRNRTQIGEPVFKNVLVCVKKNYDYEDKKLNKNSAYKVLRTLAQTEDSHDVVAFWMIKMNTVSAEYLRNSGKGIFRSSETSSRSPNTIPQTMLHWLGNYSSSAIYSTVSAPHNQLGVNSYVHITSPIRRLVDILNQIQMNTEISESCQLFLEKWQNNLIFVNRATKEIRKTQMDCELLALTEKINFAENNEYSGILFDQHFINGKYEYAVYIEELKMMSRIKLPECVENFTKLQFRVFVFNDEDRLCKKIRLQIV